MEDLRKAARKILQNNERSVVLNGRTYVYTVPSASKRPKPLFEAPWFSLSYYPFQWFWDSCFHAIVYTALGEPERAKKELRSLLIAQHQDGFIPHVIFWDKTKIRRRPWYWHYQESEGRWTFLPFTRKPETSIQIQPPLLAQAVERIWEADHDHEFLREMLPKLNRYYRWLFEARDPDHDNLITIISPYESGLDWSPAYDPVLGVRGKPTNPLLMALKWRGVTLTNKLRFDYNLSALLAKGPFHVEDVLVNSILALNCVALSRLNGYTSNAAEGAFFEDKARKVTAALLSKCYDKNLAAFFNLSGRNEQRFPVLAVQSLMPLILPDLPKEIATEMIERHLENEKEFWLPYPLPSVAASEPAFSAESKVGNHTLIWRGTSWVNTNWYLVHGLRQCGYHDLADHIAQKTRELILKSGFREHFNPYTGEGYGAENFGWSTLVVDM